MSETKVQALEYASRLGHTVLSDLLASATAIEAFITGGVAPAGKAAGKGKGAASTAAAAQTEQLPSSASTAPATTPATKPAAAAALGAAPGAPTKESVGAVMVKLIQANLREKVVEILKSVGAADLSSIPADKYADVVNSANEALLLA